MKAKILFLSFALLASTSMVKAQSDKPANDSDSVYTKVEKPAEFPGGADGWRTYLMKSLRYPKKAQKNNIQGVAKVSFVVDTEGAVSDIKVITHPGGGLGDEAARIIRTGPKWIPAEQAGRKVKYSAIQSITFQFQ